MKWELSYLPEENIVYAKTEGDAEVGALNTMVKALKKALDENNSTLAISDHTGLSDTIGIVDIYQRPGLLETLGAQRDAKVAIIYPESRYRDFSFLETVFKNRGWFGISIHKDIDSAKKWLLSK